MKELRGVCIGAGYFSQFHFEAWQRIPNVSITAICDTDLVKANKAAKKFGFLNTYDTIETMFLEEKPDFVDIISPPETHLTLCLLAKKHGIHIICQKPLAPTLKEAQSIGEAFNGSSVRMMVHENFRFMPWYREVKKLLKHNTIGDSLHCINLHMRMGDGWQTDAYMNRQPYFREMKQLLIYETGVHFIDVFRFLFGDINEVYAKLKTLNSNIKGEDFAWVQVEFKNGIQGFIDANRYNENVAENPRLTFGKVLIEGNKGSIRIYDDGKITVQLLGEKEKEHNYTFKDQNFAGDCVYHTQKHFVESLVNGVPFETEVSEYLNNLKVQEAVYRSNQTGLPVILD